LDDKTCGACQFWKTYPEAYKWNKNLGQCRIQSPKLDQDGGTLWPDTRYDDWCGDWKAKNSKTGEIKTRKK